MFAHYRFTIVIRPRYVPGPETITYRFVIAVPKTNIGLFDGLAMLEYDGESVEIRPTHSSSIDEDDTVYVVPRSWLDTLSVLTDTREIYDHFRYLYLLIAAAPDLKYTFVGDEADEN